MSCKPKVWLDLDGTLAKEDGPHIPGLIHPPFEGAQEFVREIAAFADIGIHTARTSSEPLPMKDVVSLVKSWLRANGFGDLDVWVGKGKPRGKVYGDNRSVPIQPGEFSDPKEVYRAAMPSIHKLCGIKK